MGYILHLTSSPQKNTPKPFQLAHAINNMFYIFSFYITMLVKSVNNNNAMFGLQKQYRYNSKPNHPAKKPAITQNCRLAFIGFN